MPVTKRQMSRTARTNQVIVFRDNSASADTGNIVATGYDTARITRITLHVVENFVTNDIDLDIGFAVSNGTVVADPDAYADGLDISDVDRGFDETGAALATTGFDALVDLDAGHRFEMDLDILIPAHTIATYTFNDPGDTAGSLYAVIEYELIESKPVEV